MRTYCSAAAAYVCLAAFSLSLTPVHADDLDLDMWQSAFSVGTGNTSAAASDSNFQYPIVGPDPVFGQVSRYATVTQPDTSAALPPGRGTEAFTGTGNLFFNAHDSHGMLALDYQFEDPVVADGIHLDVRNAGITDFTLALFIEKAAPVLGPNFAVDHSDYTATWDFASSATIDPSSQLETYGLATNYGANIYGMLIVYNPRNDLLTSVPNSIFNSGVTMFPTNESSIEVELCCVGVPEPSSCILLGLGLALGMVRFVRRRRH